MITCPQVEIAWEPKLLRNECLETLIFFVVFLDLLISFCDSRKSLVLEVQCYCISTWELFPPNPYIKCTISLFHLQFFLGILPFIAVQKIVDPMFNVIHENHQSDVFCFGYWLWNILQVVIYLLSLATK